MKGDEAEYVVALAPVFTAPKNKRIRRAITHIKRFVAKHTRIRNVKLTDDVNRALHENSKNLPRRITVTLRKTGKKGDEAITVYLKGSKQLAADKKSEEEKKRKGKEKAAKKEEKETTAGKEDKAAEEEEKKRLEEKREKEKAAQALEVKRK